MRSRLGQAAVFGALAVILLFTWLKWKDRHRNSIPDDANAASAEAASAHTWSVREETASDAASGSFEGRVTDVEGRGIVGAQVCASLYSSRSESSARRDPRCTAAGEGGRYRIDALARGTYMMDASMRGYRPASFRDRGRPDGTVQLGVGQAREGMDIALEAGGVAVRGRVKDIGGGPIVAAKVMLQPEYQIGDEGGTVTESNAQGEWEAWASAGRVYVRASAEGYAEGSQSGIAPGQFIEIEMMPGSVLEGRVVEAGTEKKVVGARVTAGLSGGALVATGGTDDPMAVRTDDEGRFRISRLQPGRYKPEAMTEHGWGLARESVGLGVGETSAEVIIEVGPTVSVVGKVERSDGKACTRGFVQLADTETRETRAGEIEGDGRMRIPNMMPGRYKVDVRCRDALAESSYEDVLVADKDVTGLVWKVNAGLSLRGVLVDSENKPIFGGHVYAHIKGDGPGPRSSGSCDTERDGAFHIDGLRAGEYEVSYNQSGRSLTEPMTVKVARDVSGLRLTIPAVGGIEGKVTDASGAPVAGTNVHARGTNRRDSADGTTRDDGTFVITGVSPGEYRVSVVKREPPRTGTADDEGTPVTVRARETARVKLLGENPRGQIQGRVVGGAGEPLPNAFVDVQREAEGAENSPKTRSGRRQLDRSHEVLVDPEGNFTLTKLSPGLYTVRAYFRAGGIASVEHVRVGSKVTITLRPPGAMAGTVSMGNGSTPDRFTVSVSDLKAGIARQEVFFRTGGAFNLGDLPPGDYDVSAESSEGRALAKVALAQGERRQGVRLTLEANAKVRGRVLDLESGKPVAGMGVSAEALKGRTGIVKFLHEHGKNVTDAEGWYELSHVPPGRVKVQASMMRSNSDYGYAEMVATLDAGRTMELPPLRAPRLRHKGPSAGDLGFDVHPSTSDEEPEQRRQVVAAVRAGGPAARGGLVVGDEIVSIDSHDVAGANAYLYWSFARVPEGTSVNLGLRRGSTISIQAGKER